MPLSGEDDSEASFNHPIGDVDAVGEPNDVGEWDSVAVCHLCVALKLASVTSRLLGRLTEKFSASNPPQSTNMADLCTPVSV